MGHARALLGLAGTQQDLVAQEVANKQLSVRQTEALVRKLTKQGNAASKNVARKMLIPPCWSEGLRII